ncbi:hypothetical protein AB4Z45_03485 [Paenibacillus sp. MCAF9]
MLKIYKFSKENESILPHIMVATKLKRLYNHQMWNSYTAVINYVNRCNFREFSINIVHRGYTLEENTKNSEEHLIPHEPRLMASEVFLTISFKESDHYITEE